MTPINEVPVGKFVKFHWNILYVCKNNHKDTYTLVPIIGVVPENMEWGHGVYVYKRVRKEWLQPTKDWIEYCLRENRIDNLTYIENLDILKSYGI